MAVDRAGFPTPVTTALSIVCLALHGGAVRAQDDDPPGPPPPTVAETPPTAPPTGQADEEQGEETSTAPPAEPSGDAPPGEAPPGVVPVPELGPVVINPRPELEFFHLEDVEVAFEFEWRRDVDDVGAADGRSRRDTEDRVREIFEVSTRGFMGHPNLFRFEALGRVWLTQRRLDLESNPRTEHTNETMLEYDVRGTFLEKQKVPITIYSRRSENDIDRQFGGSLENRWMETGIIFDLREDVMPTTVRLFRREQEQSDRAGNQDFSIDQDTFEADGQVLLGDGHDIWWDYSYDDIVQSGDLRTGRSFVREEANVTHRLKLGSEKRHQLRSTVRHYEESDLGLRQFRIEERLRLHHDDSLTSWIDYTEDRLRRSGLQQISREGSANFRQQLFDSLVTVGRTGLRWLDIPSDDFESDEVAGELGFDYTKRVPGGTVLALLGGYASRLDETDRGAPVQIAGQRFTFDASGLVIIRARNVDTSSIRIRDLSGVILYSEGVDYTVQGFFEQVEIRRVPGGDISAGQTVLIDYEIGPQPGGRTDALGMTVDLRYTFDEGALRGLSVYGRYTRQDEDRMLDLELVTRDPERFADNDFTEWKYGVEYDYGRLFARAERVTHESNLSPFNTNRLEGRWTERLDRGSALILGALYQEIERPNESTSSSTTTLSGRWTQQWGFRLRTSLIVLYQLEDSAIDSRSFEQQFDLDWRYRQTSVYAKLRNSHVDSDVDDRSFQTLIVGLRREF